MSGASPQGPGVVVGPFPGCQDTPVDGVPGQISYHIPPTGVDADGCPVGGSVLTADEINGIEQAINCILTCNGQDPLPDDCLCADPCMLYNKLVEIFSIPECPTDASPDNTYTLTCDGNGANWQSGGGGGITLCPNDGLPIGWQRTLTSLPNQGLTGVPPNVQQGDTFPGSGFGESGVWMAVRNPFMFNDGEQGGDSFQALDIVKIEC